MENIEGLSREEIEGLVLEQLAELAIDVEAVEVEIIKASKVVLRGKVKSERERRMIKESMDDIAGIDEVIDELVVTGAETDDLEEDEEDQEDEETIGTEDAFQSIEDGIPYIPPIKPVYREEPKDIKWKKKRKKK